MKVFLCIFGLAGLMSRGVVLAQQSPSTTMPSSVSSDHGQSAPPVSPSYSPTAIPLTRPEIEPPTPAAPATWSADLHMRVQKALRQQLPEAADEVRVNVADDGSLELVGAVVCEREREHVEEVARSAAPNYVIVNKLRVGGSASGTRGWSVSLPPTH
jgi:hypothetical protein